MFWISLLFWLTLKQNLHFNTYDPHYYELWFVFHCAVTTCVYIKKSVHSNVLVVTMPARLRIISSYTWEHIKTWRRLNVHSVNLEVCIQIFDRQSKARGLAHVENPSWFSFFMRQSQCSFLKAWENTQVACDNKSLPLEYALTSRSFSWWDKVYIHHSSNHLDWSLRRIQILQIFSSVELWESYMILINEEHNTLCK